MCIYDAKIYWMIYWCLVELSCTQEHYMAFSCPSHSLDSFPITSILPFPFCVVCRCSIPGASIVHSLWLYGHPRANCHLTLGPSLGLRSPHVFSQEHLPVFTSSYWVWLDRLCPPYWKAPVFVMPVVCATWL